jgi:hypothetical protein
MRKPGLTFEQHVEAGRELAALSDTLSRRYIAVANAYPKNARFTSSLHRSLDALRRARSELDDQLARDFPAQFDTHIYYP